MNADKTPVIFIDQGTTNTRVWLARGADILGRTQAQVGVRDTARDGSSARLREALRTSIAAVRQQCSAPDMPRCVIAAGMIASSLGLAEVAHIEAPAGMEALASATRRVVFSDVTDLPIFLVPGIRTGRFSPDSEVCDVDLMRGEETLCLGLAAQGLIRSPGMVLNLGSHWKIIQFDEQSRIAGSLTTLSGEMIHAVQTTTILASAVPGERSEVLDSEWVAAGMKEQRRSGLPRALFCVRLLEQAKSSTPAQRFAFLAGAFIACDLDALRARGMIAKDSDIAIVGNAAIAGAWTRALTDTGLASIVIGERETEASLLAGLRTILQRLPAN